MTDAAEPLQLYLSMILSRWRSCSKTCGYRNMSVVYIYRTEPKHSRTEPNKRELNDASCTVSHVIQRDVISFPYQVTKPLSRAA